MIIKEIAKKYNLEKDIDFWRPQFNPKMWIIKHDACEKIASAEGINLVEIKILNSEKDFARFLITMSMGDKKVTSVGEADPKNCKNAYYGCMAEKRGIDRCVLKLIKAYEYGVYSDVEADDFKEGIKPMTKYQAIQIVEILKHKEGYDKSVVKGIFKNLTHDDAKGIIEHLQSGRIEEAVSNFYELKEGEGNENKK